MDNRHPVLLVDPFADERNMYAAYLRARGLDVAVCKSPVAALSFARRHSVSVVITRIFQAGSVDGIALTRALKQDERTRRIPVIVITTQAHGTARSEAKKAGCDRLLLLPCLPEQLVSEIRRITIFGTTASES